RGRGSLPAPPRRCACLRACRGTPSFPPRGPHSRRDTSPTGLPARDMSGLRRGDADPGCFPAPTAGAVGRPPPMLHGNVWRSRAAQDAGRPNDLQTAAALAPQAAAANGHPPTSADHAGSTAGKRAAPTHRGSVPGTKPNRLSTKLTSGALAGITGTALIFPIDLVKTRLQNATKDAKGNLPSHFPVVFSLPYVGMGANLVGITPEKAIKLAVNDYTREKLAERKGVLPDNLPTSALANSAARNHQCVDAFSTGGWSYCRLLSSGGYGAVMGKLIFPRCGSALTARMPRRHFPVPATTPMEIIKINLQISSTTTPPGQKLPTGLDVVRKLGLRGIYKGTGATLLRDVVGRRSRNFTPPPRAMALRSGGSTRSDRAHFAPSRHGSVPFPYVFGSGIVAGMVAAAAVTPMDGARPVVL
ncbi:MAG: mitochondrial carrier domain-containing protein, partial [Olpidium bornovanus]